MTKIDQDYIVGLDIGTNSCGWVATDFKNKILRMHGKNAIGSHLFEEGEAAADRRGFRTTRRRIKRRKWRLRLLEEIFDPYMSEVDPYFFARLKEAGLSPNDTRKNVSSIVYPSAKEDQEFYQKYPTIYHLRRDLMTKDKQFDIREVFLAIHHIVKYRGNFLQDTSVKDFDAAKIDVKETISILNEYYAELSEQSSIKFEAQNANKIEDILRDKTIFKLDKSKQIAKLLPLVSENKNESKLRKDIAKQIANAILGYKTKFETILMVDIDKNDQSNWEFKLTDVDADDKFEQIIASATEVQQSILVEIRKLFSAITLSGIVDEGKTLSESMIRKYEDHKEDLQLLKKAIKNHPDKGKANKLALAYDLYVNNRHGHILEAKTILKKKGVLSKEDFYAEVKKNLDDSENSQRILNEIALDSFMPKQRTNENGVIPFQLHQIELDKIIEKQGKYYPFLAEKNPVEAHLTQAPYKLDELVRFRVPYYVGPMIEPDQDTENEQTLQNQNFAWMVRKEKGQITPWNFDQKVDRMESANRFIKRMTTKDTYLLGEDVLPANSLIYQRFTVLNELNNIRINGERISVELKQELYNNLFKNNTSVTSNKLINYLREQHQVTTVELKGLADTAKFNSGLTTYNKLKNTHLFDKEIDSSEYQNDFEKIIEWSTIFEDKTIYQEKLRTLSWLSADQIKVLTNLRLQGWGRLSKKLLVGLHDTNGQTIMEQLWDSQKNFMQIVNEADFKDAITHENQQIVKATSTEDILADAYTSPANKKAIRQVMKVVDDIVKAASGKAPKQIAIEFARDAQKSEQTIRRSARLRSIYKNIASDLLSETIKDEIIKVDDKEFAQDKYYLYFMQGGRDAYTGQPINIDEVVSGYQIDHILPQSFIKDDSLDNRVLVASPVNNGKSDNVPAKMFGNKFVPDLGMTISQMWNKWHEIGLISDRKLKNLKLDPAHINKYQASGFINRQLVETSQIIKLVATILQVKYPHSEIIVVKASANHYLRKHLNLYKSREVNDYHHAIDAYLSTICGNLLYQVYPKLRPFFVYGQFKKFSSDPEQENDVLKKTRHFDFIPRIFENDDNQIHAGNNGPIVFDRQKDIIDPLKRAYNFKYMLVSRETSTRDQEMFKMTLYPRADRDTAKTRNLIPKAKEMPTAIYGGYSNNSDAYMAIIKINKKKESEYRVVGVPMRALTALNNSQNYNNELEKILAPTVLFNKNGKRKAAILSFEIVKGKVPYKQVILDGDKKFMLGSSTYVYNDKQLTLSWDAMKVITGNLKSSDSDEVNKTLLATYDEILEKVDRYLPLFDINKFREKLHQGRDKFIKLSIDEKESTLLQILDGLHDNPVMGNLKNLGISTPFGQMQMPSGIVLSNKSILIYQSPTGLFEKRVKISNL